MHSQMTEQCTFRCDAYNDVRRLQAHDWLLQDTGVPHLHHVMLSSSLVCSAMSTLAILQTEDAITLGVDNGATRYSVCCDIDQ